MNLGEVAEARIGEGGEKRVTEIDLGEQGVILDRGFRRGKRGDFQQLAEGGGRDRGSQWQHDDPAVAGELPRRGEGSARGGLAENQELRLLELISGDGVLTPGARGSRRFWWAVFGKARRR